MIFSFKTLRKATQEVSARVRGETDDAETPTQEKPRKLFRGPWAVVGGLALAASAYFVTGQVMGSVNTNELPSIDLPPGTSQLVNTSARILERQLKTGWAPNSRISPLSTRTDLDAYQRGISDVLRLVSQRMPAMFSLGTQSSGGMDLIAAGNDINREPDVWNPILASDDSAARLEQGMNRYKAFNERMAQHGDRIHLTPRIDGAADLVNALIPFYQGELTRLKDVVEHEGTLLHVRNPYYHAQGVMYATHEILKAFRIDFEPVLDRQSSLASIDQLIADSAESLPYNPLVVLNGTGFGYSGGNVQAMAGVVSGTLADLKVLQDSLAGGASRSMSNDQPPRPGAKAPVVEGLQHKK